MLLLTIYKALWASCEIMLVLKINLKERILDANSRIYLLRYFHYHKLAVFIKIQMDWKVIDTASYFIHIAYSSHITYWHEIVAVLVVMLRNSRLGMWIYFCSLRGPLKNICLALIQLHFYTVSLHGHCKLLAHYSSWCQPDANIHGFGGLGNNHNLHQLTSSQQKWACIHIKPNCINNFYN